MSKSFDRYQKRRLRSSYFSVVISIAIVLFMVGVLGLLLLKSTTISNYYKEKVTITLYLKDKVTKPQVESFKKSLLKESFAKQVVYINKEDAAKKFSDEIGEDFLTFLGENPLKNGIDIYLKADFVTPEKIQELGEKFKKNHFVFQVYYDKPLVQLLTKNIQKISFWLLVVSGVFCLISVVLINSAIRLSVYAKRFNIKTMQMVGATKSFIRKPFIISGIKLGFLGALIASILLFTLIYYIDKYVPNVTLLTDYKLLIYLFIGVFFTAFLITLVSTFLATQRFLNLQTDELYY